MRDEIAQVVRVYLLLSQVLGSILAPQDLLEQVLSYEPNYSETVGAWLLGSN